VDCVSVIGPNRQWTFYNGDPDEIVVCAKLSYSDSCYSGIRSEYC